METIKVNMTPCEDIKTIHASQNDNEAREWGFELHNNGEKIDSSSISDQLVFKAYEGGTEEILPTNESTPTTSPFKGDIKYPQGLLSDQEFLYRESPTEEDGLAKIQTIYGNTLKWNQLATFTPRSGTDTGITSEFKADGTMVFNGTATDNFYSNFGNTYHFQGHKLYIKGCPSGGSNSTYYLRDGYNGVASERDFGNGVVVTARANTILQIQILQGVTVTNLTFTPQLFDLTAMGLDTLTDDEVKQWFDDYFPLPYYQYDSGSLLPFRGEGLKTVGKNLLDKTLFSENSTSKPEQTSTGVKVISKNGGSYGNVGTVVISNLTPFIGKTFILSADVQTSNRSGLALQVRDENNVEKAWRITYTTGPASVTLAITDDFIGCYLRVAIYAIGGSGVVGDYSIYDNLQLEIGSSQVTSYEPYTESTLSLPISTYFPTGMKSAVSVYDELTPMKAITRIGSIDMGTLEWVLNNPSANIFSVYIDIKAPSDYEARKTGFINPKYPPSSGYAISPSMDDKSMLRLNGNIFIRDTSYSDVTAFKASLSGVYLYYELATPTETSFTTASLVTENGEIPLSNEDGTLIGKCTEKLASRPGFFNAKIRLSDGDGDCYSNKLQLHVEKKPS